MIAEAAARAVEFVGLPEARLTLAHATLALSLMPKSNSVTRALGAATSAVQAGGLVEVPAHLRDASYASAKKIGHGSEYQYSHDYPGGWVDQQYLPDRWKDATFYDASPYGHEASLAESWRSRTGRSHQDEPEAPVE